MAKEDDVRILAEHLMLMEEIRAIDEDFRGGYPSERKSRREAAVRQYMAHLPAVREILLRGKS